VAARLGVRRLRTGISWGDWHRPGAPDWFDRQMEALAEFDTTSRSASRRPRAGGASATRRRRSVSTSSPSSRPLERARQTAAAIAGPHHLTAVCDDAFMEVDFGEWTGRTTAELHDNESWRAFNTVRGTTRIPGGELMLDVQARAVHGLLRLAREHPDDRVAVITHADVIRSLLAHALAMPLDAMLRLEVAPASLSEVELHGTWPRVTCINRGACDGSVVATAAAHAR
jgi:broad specificity phosphatase PhoE